VCVNAFAHDEENEDIDLLRITEATEREQAGSVQALRARRDEAAVGRTLERLQAACRDPKDNLMPHLIDCVNAYCTEGEIVEAMAAVYGRYTERAVL
jgi:methylmalonyl-CoA mutase, N-terminal domain